jgi:tetratricopeptide (TPR) repeat protein
VEFMSVAPFQAGDVAGMAPLVKHALPSNPAPAVQRLLRVARQQLASGETQTAYDVAQEAQMQQMNVTGPLHPTMAAIYALLAQVFVAAGAMGMALANQAHAVRLLQRLVGPDHPDTVQATSTLGDMLLAGGKTKEALEVWQRVMAMQLLVAGEDGGTLAQGYARMASAFQMEGHWRAAVACIQWAMELASGDTRVQLELHHMLAQALAKAGSFRQAQAVFRQHHNMCSQLLGDDHPATQASVEEYRDMTKKVVALTQELRDRPAAAPTAASDTSATSTAKGTVDSASDAASAAAKTTGTGEGSKKRKNRKNRNKWR